MSNDISQIPLGEMLKGIVREFHDAMAMVKRSHPPVTVRAVKLSIGQQPDTADKPGEPASPASLLVSNRYPTIAKGWLMEVEVGEGVSARFNDDLLNIQSQPLPTALDLLGDYPIVAIKGIDTIWKRIFADIGITHISHMARLSDTFLHNLIQNHPSLLPP